jgi:radical SAM superfamily enzyme YgiQ (UPF0313 family)
LRILLVYPHYPDTFWSFRHVLQIVPKKATYPPLGLLTVAALLPQDWEKRLVDLNVTGLSDEDLQWADYVFISAMTVQKSSMEEIVHRCKKYDTKTVAGGPLFSNNYIESDGIDYLLLDEAEVTIPEFLKDLNEGCARHIYTAGERADIEHSPNPMWTLIDIKKYAAMSIQYSRGCPHNCDFCDAGIRHGNRPRTKLKDQVLAELDTLYDRGWRGGVFIADDNFIASKRKLKQEILPAIIGWQKARKYPVLLLTQSSIQLADDEELMQLMVEAGFETVFVGIETPDEAGLTECNKQQNRHRDLLASIKKIQNHGLQVQGGFILGFDSDSMSIFECQINFIQKSGIVTAMVGLLNAQRGTSLYERLKAENRLLEGSPGDNTDCSINFVPKMDREALINGYKHVLATVYSPKQYYERIKIFQREYRPQRRKRISQLQFWHVWALLRSIWFLGVKERGRRQYWQFFISALVRHTGSFPLCMAFTVYGFHFRTVVRKHIVT